MSLITQLNENLFSWFCDQYNFCQVLYEIVKQTPETVDPNGPSIKDAPQKRGTQGVKIPPKSEETKV